MVISQWETAQKTEDENEVSLTCNCCSSSVFSAGTHSPSLTCPAVGSQRTSCCYLWQLRRNWGEWGGGAHLDHVTDFGWEKNGSQWCEGEGATSRRLFHLGNRSSCGRPALKQSPWVPAQKTLDKQWLWVRATLFCSIASILFLKNSWTHFCIMCNH